jgi:hypothetical protein
LYSSADIIGQIKSSRMWWTGHVARVGEGRTYTGFWWESLKESSTFKAKAQMGEGEVDWGVGVDSSFSG